MSRPNLSLKFRVRYEGLVRTFDRRTQKDIDADYIDSPIQRVVVSTLKNWAKSQKKKKITAARA